MGKNIKLLLCIIKKNSKSEGKVQKKQLGSYVVNILFMFKKNITNITH